MADVCWVKNALFPATLDGPQGRLGCCWVIICDNGSVYKAMGSHVAPSRPLVGLIGPQKHCLGLFASTIVGKKLVGLQPPLCIDSDPGPIALFSSIWTP